MTYGKKTELRLSRSVKLHRPLHIFCIRSLLSVSLFLNSSCYFMAAQSDSTKVHDTQITRSNENILNYTSVVRFHDFDLDSKQFKLALSRYPIVSFQQDRKLTVGKADFGRTFVNGSVGYGTILLLIGLIGIGLLEQDSNTSISPQSQDAFNALTSPGVTQNVLVGAGSFIALDFLISLLTYIPGTREDTDNLQESRMYDLSAVTETLVEVTHPLSGKTLLLNTDKNGILSVPMHFFLTKSEGLSQSAMLDYNIDVPLSSSAFNPNTQNFAALIKAVDELLSDN